MLLNDLLETSIVQSSELGQVMDVCNDIGKSFLEVFKLLFIWRVVRLDGSDNSVDFLFGVFDATRNFASFDALESVDLVKFSFEETNETFFVFLGPCFILSECFL